MIPEGKLQVLRDGVLADGNVSLAVAFGGSAHHNAAPITLVVDCRDSDPRTIQRFASGLTKQLQERLDVFRLDDARPAAILMRQALEEGQVLKDEDGQWEQVEAERDEIVAEAGEHESWAERLNDAVEAVVAPDDNVTLAVEFSPIRLEDENDPSNMNLLLGCADESEETLLAIHAKLQETGFRIEVMPLAKARDFPYALSHIVRTGRALKDTDGEWRRLQSERDEIVAAGIKQHREVQAIKRLYGGPGGSTSMN
jgi:hypothetical protein